MPGLRGPPPAGSGDAASAGVPRGRTRGQELVTAARAAVLACFVALVAHTMAYAGFLEDPLTWVLLSIGGSLALAPPLPTESGETRPGGEAVAPTPARAPA